MEDYKLQISAFCKQLDLPYLNRVCTKLIVFSFKDKKSYTISMQMHNMELSIILFVLNYLGWRVRMAIKYEQEAKTRTFETFEAKPKFFLPDAQRCVLPVSFPVDLLMP